MTCVYHLTTPSSGLRLAATWPERTAAMNRYLHYSLDAVSGCRDVSNLAFLDTGLLTGQQNQQLLWYTCLVPRNPSKRGASTRNDCKGCDISVIVYKPSLELHETLQGARTKAFRKKKRVPRSARGK